MQLELTEKTKIDASPEVVHEWLSNLENWPKINDKIKSISVEGNKCIGQLQFKGQTLDFAGVVPEDNDPLKVICNIVVQSEQGKKTPGHFEVIYEIVPGKKNTQIIERVIFEQEIPFWGWLLVKLIMKLGNPMGTTNLQRIKEHISDTD
ncbi:SRPBCC family protein [uncultured Gimesia sp.]|uniref:SRPBCC family protein n=1 Tax=uncultured Gimesia sp. TaxID=1678688 RepID=UPI002613401A|nr:SRPBCC family protein [uncultured Gimesia sp.]